MTAESTTTPRAEVTIDELLIRQLLEEQHPSFAAETLAHVADGWDNSTWRLGELHAIRLPRRKSAVTCIQNEQRCLPLLAGRLSIDVPLPIAVGRPSRRYPWPWSIVPWFKASTAADAPLPATEAKHVARVLRSIHRPAPPHAPQNPYRGVPLQERRQAFEKRLDRLEHQLAQDGAPSDVDPARFRSLFSRGEQSAWEDPPVWLHGDLHPKNILVADHQLTALIDWGDVTAGDPASDLACVWMLFSNAAHPHFWQDYEAEAGGPLEQRARAWATFFGVLFLSVGLEDNPPLAAIGARTLKRACVP